MLGMGTPRDHQKLNQNAERPDGNIASATANLFPSDQVDGHSLFSRRAFKDPQLSFQPLPLPPQKSIPIVFQVRTSPLASVDGT